MSRAAALIFAALALIPSRALAETACVTLPNGEIMTCADGDKCVKNPSAGVWLTVGRDTYQCRKASGATDLPRYRESSAAPVLRPSKVPPAKPFSFGSFPKLTRSAVPAAAATQAAPPEQKTAQRRPRAAAASPAEAYRTAGYAHYARADLSNAIASWEKAVELDPGMRTELSLRLAEAYARRGAMRLLSGDTARSISDLDHAYELDPGNRTIEKARERAYLARSGRPEASGAGVRPSAPAADTQDAARGPEPGTRTATDGDASAGGKLEPLWIAWSVILWLLWCASLWIGGAMTADGIRNSPGLSPRAGKWRAVNGFFASLAAAFFIVSVLLTLFMALGVPFKTAAANFTYKWILPSACAGAALAAAIAFIRIARIRPGSVVYAATGSAPAVGHQFKGASRPGRTPEILEKAKELSSAKQYEEALKALSRKPFEELEPDDLNLFLDLYIKVGDFSRAKLILNRIAEAAEEFPELAGNYAYYLSLVPACREKGESALASQLRQTGADFILKALSVAGAPREIYSLAKEMEKEGETEIAVGLYQAFVRAGYQYLDAEERFKELKARPAPAARAQAPSFQTGRGAHLVGQVLEGRYQIRGSLGEGAMGVVYEGWDLKGSRKVAIKRMHTWLKTYPEEYKRFKREAEIVGRLKHPNIVGVNAITEQGGEIFLVFDFVDGRPLSEVLGERKRIPLSDCLTVLQGVCEAVHYAHGQNVIHRDLKLANIMVDKGLRAMVVDFGLASELRDSLTRVSHQTMSGTPAYMAPEQYSGLVKRESDIYAIGVCLYELLTGELPFQGADPLKLKKEKDYREVTSMLPWLPSGIDGLLARALEPEPSQRIADAMDLFDSLKRL